MCRVIHHVLTVRSVNSRPRYSGVAVTVAKQEANSITIMQKQRNLDKIQIIISKSVYVHQYMYTTLVNNGELVTSVV